jgi:glycosyltransferase involved in cell wall biosynthesis
VDRSRLKVLYISRGYTVHDRRFLASFAGRGWNTSYLPLLDERLEYSPLPDDITKLEWDTEAREPLSSADWKNREQNLRRLLGEVAPDVVIAGPIQSGAYLAALAGAHPLVAVSWGTDILVDADRTPEMQKVTAETLSRSAAAFGDCRAVREAIKRHSALNDQQIVTFPWGIDLDRFTPGESSLDLRQRLGWNGNEIYISTRTWEPVYAIDVLVEAFALVHEENPDARLALLGDGSQEDAIRTLIKEHDLESEVHAPGRVSHALLPDYFRTANVYVSSALSDGTSVSLLEAMATGLPVVVSDSYGNLEWVEPGTNGELARPGDPESLADAMLAVASDPMGVARMRAANIAAARSRADWTRNFPLLAKKVESLASG